MKRTDHTIVDWEADGSGLHHLECSCGHQVHDLPDLETIIDMYGDHIWNQAFQAGQQDGGQS